jgi:hypothetical protein
MRSTKLSFFNLGLRGLNKNNASVPGRSGMCMVIVVPSFAKGQESDEPVIGGIIVRGEAA